MKKIKVYATIQFGVTYEILVPDTVATDMQKCYYIAEKRIESDMQSKGIDGHYEAINLDIIK